MLYIVLTKPVKGDIFNYRKYECRRDEEGEYNEK